MVLMNIVKDFIAPVDQEEEEELELDVEEAAITVSTY